MKRIFIASIATVFTLALFATERTATITIDDRIKHQHVTGFGGFSPSPQWSYWLNDKQMDMLFGHEDDQLGLNIVRLYIANDKNAWNWGLANAKRAQKHGAFIFASPWSPPAAWKDNNSDSNGGKLLASHYRDWAVFLNDYYKYLKTNGVELNAISIQNEPDWKAEYQSCIWTGEELASFLKDYGDLIECKIMAPESIHFTRNMHEPMLNDPEACKHIDIVAGHFYGWDGSAYPLAAQKGKEVWMTEFLINERQNNEKKDINWIDDGFLFARSINDAMLADMSAWVHYSLKRFYGAIGDGTYGTADNKITKRGYILSHYAKYVAGTTRIHHSLADNSGKLSSSAYLTASGDSIVVMVINPTADYYTTTITLPFNTDQWLEVVTNENDNMAKWPVNLDDETYTPEVEVDAYSVSTYVFARSSDRNDLPTHDDDGECIYADNFDLAGAGCIPQGWIAQSESELRHAGNYGLGPRIMSFSAEGAMRNAFYFRGGANGGYISYGEESKHRLCLQPGTYTVEFAVEGWKALPGITFTLETTDGTVITQVDATPTSFVSANGGDSRISDPRIVKQRIDIAQVGNYVIRWSVEKKSGLNEALVGNIRIYGAKSSQAAIEADRTQDTAVFYDLNGRSMPAPSAPGVYIRNGEKVAIGAK